MQPNPSEEQNDNKLLCTHPHLLMSVMRTTISEGSPPGIPAVFCIHTLCCTPLHSAGTLGASVEFNPAPQACFKRGRLTVQHPLFCVLLCLFFVFCCCFILLHTLDSLTQHTSTLDTRTRASCEMNRLEGGRDSPEEQPEQGSLSAEPLLPKQEKGRGSNTSREAKVQGDTVGSASEATRGDSGSAAEAASTTAATVEKYPSYIRREKSTTGPTAAVGGGCNEEAKEEAERETEKGYEGGDRVRLLVGRYDIIRMILYFYDITVQQYMLRVVC